VISTHLPALQIILPLLAAPLCVILRNGTLTYWFSVVVAWLAFAVSALLLQEVNAVGVIAYKLGGWEPPWGIEYRIDLLNAYVLLIVSAIGALTISYAKPSVDQEIGGDRDYLFYTAFLLCLAGLLGVTITGDAFNIFVFLEISSLSSYALIAMGRDRRALTASYRYLVFGTIGATFFLIGVGLLYQMTGTLNMADMADKLNGLHDNRAVLTAVAFLVIGLGMKMALFPLHGWLPNAHGYAPPIVSALLSAVTIKVGAYVLIRFLFSVLGPRLSFETLPTTPLLLALASMAILAGSYMAIQQPSLKKVLAYSSVAQMGYITLGVALANEQGLTGALIHIFNHALTKSGLFLVSGIIVYRFGTTDLVHLRGLGRHMPWTMAAFVAGGLGLIGVPLTAGFISKWYLVTGAMDKGMTFLPVIILLGSLLAVIYIWRIVEIAYFQEPEETEPRVQEGPWSLVLPAWLLIGASLYFGIDASVSSWLANNAARALLGAG